MFVWSLAFSDRESEHDMTTETPLYSAYCTCKEEAAIVLPADEVLPERRLYSKVTESTATLVLDMLRAGKVPVSRDETWFLSDIMMSGDHDKEYDNEYDQFVSTVLQLLHHMGTDLRARNEVALVQACTYGLVKSARFLLEEAGADCWQLLYQSENVGMGTVMPWKASHEEVRKLLEQRGLNCSEVCTDPATAQVTDDEEEDETISETRPPCPPLFAVWSRLDARERGGQ